MIGAKTLGTLSLLAVTLIVCGALGALRPERLLAQRADAALVMGALAVVSATLMFRFLRLSDRSTRYFRFSKDNTWWEDEAHFLGTARRRIVVGENNEGAAFDLSGSAQFAVCLLVGLLVGAATLNARALSLLVEFPAAVTKAGSTYCPEQEEEREPTAAEDPTAPGCALIRRAYELGYAKDLGDCATKKKVGGSRELCTLRQRDEPTLHYAYRLLHRFGHDVSSAVTGGYFARMKTDFDQRVERVEHLYITQKQVMASAPHASHHIWTNLPDPGGAFDERTCTDRYRELPYRPRGGDNAPSKVFEHVLAQLLFESRYEPAAGYCREYHVHWSAPVDACKRLAENPEAFLNAADALTPVRATLLRHRLAEGAAAVLQAHAVAAGKEGQGAKVRRTPEPQSFLSFHCYMETDERVPGAGAQPQPRRTRDFQLDGVALQVAEVTAPITGQRSLSVDRYQRLASLLAPSFHYGALMSEAGLSTLAPADGMAGMTAAFAGKGFLLSRAQALAAIDVFLAPESLADRADLLEVYPYHVHLKNYVHLFRRQYTLAKERL